MKLLKKVSTREVKRTFVIANTIRVQKNGRKFLGKITREEFLKKFEQSKKKGLGMTTAKLDTHIAEDPHRLRAYDESDWYLGEVTPGEVGVWQQAGGLPLSWTNKSLKDTADKVRRALEKNPHAITKRARRVIPNMLATNIELLQSEKCLFPIIFKSGTGTRGRKRLKYALKGDIDDGCMRSIALAVHGAKVIRAYIGFPKKARAVH
jgi:hypothetical protein